MIPDHARVGIFQIGKHFQMPNRSATRSRTRSNSVRVGSPSLRSISTLATVAMCRTSDAPPPREKLVGDVLAQDRLLKIVDGFSLSS